VQHEDLGLDLVLERPSAAEHLVHRDGQCVLIGAAVERVPHDQLRRHVLRRPDDHPGAGLRRAGRLGFRRGGQHLDHAEVAEEGVALGVEEDVARLDVAMDVAPGVDAIQRAGDRGEPPGHLARLQGPGPSPRADRPTVIERAPGRNCITAKGRSSHSPTSETLTMCGCDNRTRDRISSWNRRENSGSSSIDRSGTLITTSGVQVPVAGAIDGPHPPSPSFAVTA
jgi:hypothetical protein